MLCGKSFATDTGLCVRCLAGLPRNQHSCACCALPFEYVSGEVSEPRLCAQCLKQPPVFSKVIAPYLYTDPLSKLITGLKFHQQLYQARTLGKLLLQHLQKAAQDPPQCLVPVPLHCYRMRERGYNQALEIARPVAKALKIPLEKNLCSRHRATAPQSALNLAERKTNLHQAFEIKPVTKIQHIAIIDDVITSGQTVHELAKAFHSAGVETVEVWAVARVKLEK